MNEEQLDLLEDILELLQQAIHYSDSLSGADNLDDILYDMNVKLNLLLEL